MLRAEKPYLSVTKRGYPKLLLQLIHALAAFFFRKRVDHGSGERGIDVGVAVGQRTALGERP